METSNIFKFVWTRETKRQCQVYRQNLILHQILCSQDITLHASGGPGSAQRFLPLQIPQRACRENLGWIAPALRVSKAG